MTAFVCTEDFIGTMRSLGAISIVNTIYVGDHAVIDSLSSKVYGRHALQYTLQEGETETNDQLLRHGQQTKH